jgi:TetR/AcrR family transcriptional repressor of nem operon
MARPREFDRDVVLDRAIEVFWTRGYDRTSVQDLVETMGIQRGSLYAAFGGKQQLFLAALDRYEERFYRRMVGILSEPLPVKERIARIFRDVVLDCACESGSRGCFITNTAVALSEGDEETASRVRTNLARVEDAFESALAEANEIAARHEPRALARFLTNGLQGLRVLSRCCVNVETLQDVVDVTLSVLDEPAWPLAAARQSQKGDPQHG